MSGFENCSYIHKDSLLFANIIKAIIHIYGIKRVIRIIITGYADGLKYQCRKRMPVIPRWEYVSEKKCQLKKYGELGDEGLAKLRRCYVMKEIDKLLGNSLIWKKTAQNLQYIDYPDGIKKGPDFRKVTINFTIADECR